MSENTTFSGSNPIVGRRDSKIPVKRRSTFRFVPAVSHDLTDWLAFPVGQKGSVFLNSLTLPFKWLLWTHKSLAALTPDADVRQRLCNQSQSLGSVAGLYLVIAVSAFLMPPGECSSCIFIFIVVANMYCCVSVVLCCIVLYWWCMLMPKCSSMSVISATFFVLWLFISSLGD